MKKAMDADAAGELLKKIMSPADAQSLVMPPPDHPPHSGPAVSTPLTGNLAAPAIAGNTVAYRYRSS